MQISPRSEFSSRHLKRPLAGAGSSGSLSSPFYIPLLVQSAASCERRKAGYDACFRQLELELELIVTSTIPKAKNQRCCACRASAWLTLTRMRSGRRGVWGERRMTRRMSHEILNKQAPVIKPTRGICLWGHTREDFEHLRKMKGAL